MRAIFLKRQQDSFEIDKPTDTALPCSTLLAMPCDLVRHCIIPLIPRNFGQDSDCCVCRF